MICFYQDIIKHNPIGQHHVACNLYFNQLMKLMVICIFESVIDIWRKPHHVGKPLYMTNPYVYIGKDIIGLSAVFDPTNGYCLEQGLMNFN